MEENKRFTLRYEDTIHWGSIIQDDGDILTEEETTDLLNTLNDENEQLKKENELLKIKFHNCNNSYWKLHDRNHKLKQQLFETSKELLWATSDEVDRALHYEDEVEELRKEIFE